MSFLAANATLLVLAGREKVFVASLESLSRETFPINIAEVRPVAAAGENVNGKNASSTPPENISVVGVAISDDSKFLCAADSEKNVYIFEKALTQWKSWTHFRTEKRLLQIVFSHDARYLVMTDKCGDVWLSDMTTPGSASATAKKILGHCSVILHTCLNAESTKIFTCDRDEKIRVSSFPDSYVIKGYYLSHREAVVSIALVFKDTYLFSVDIESNLKFWKVENRSCALTFNLFNLLRLTNDEIVKNDCQISHMRVTDVHSKVYLAVKITNYEKVSVFDFDLDSLTVQLVGEIPIKSRSFDFYWVSSCLLIACPESEGLIQVAITGEGKLAEPKSCVIPQWDEIQSSIKAFIQFNQICTIPLRKRSANDELEKGPSNKILVVQEKVGTDMEHNDTPAEELVPE